VGVWIVALVALMIALAALGHARRLARKLDALTQSYWELRYDYTRLRSQIARLDPDQVPDPVAPETAASSESVSFVPLSSIRKRDR
jgi:hypothetical protein